MLYKFIVHSYERKDVDSQCSLWQWKVDHCQLVDEGASRVEALFLYLLYQSAPRGEEKDGVEYFFLTPEAFKEKIANEEFLEYEEVYENRFYGTLKAQVERQREAGQNVVFDVDVKGGINIKNHYGDEALSLFIQPPSVEELRRRLEHRGTDTPEAIEQRLAKAGYEMTFAPQFDHVIVNDDLEKAKQETLRIVSDFLK